MPRDIQKGRRGNHGVGGNDAWGARTLDQYTIPGNEPHSFEFFIYMK